MSIRQDIYDMFKGRTVHISTIVEAYKPMRTGHIAYAKVDVYPIIITPLINEGKLKRQGKGMYFFRRQK